MTYDQGFAAGVRASIDVLLAEAAQTKLDDATTMRLVESLADILRDLGLEDEEE